MLAKDFSMNYMAHLEAIKRDIGEFFSNFRTGSQILQQTLKQLAIYYTTFVEDILKQCFREAPFVSAVRGSLPSVNKAFVEYSKGF
jgi:hypothetical protein